jgi:hypothetical protein
MAVHEDGVTCATCWGIVPQDGISYVKEDGELCTCAENQPLGSFGIKAIDPKTPGALICGTCGRAWADDITPSGRCPWESLHVEDDESSEDFDEIAEEQGWDDTSMLTILRGFITERGLSEELGKRAREIADRENSFDIMDAEVTR